jgi:hypothetical protein
MMDSNRESTVSDLLGELQPEELEPRLELQVLIDPLGGFSDSSVANNCRDGAICKCVDDTGNAGLCPPTASTVQSATLSRK